MKFIIYMDETEIFIATPESEREMFDHNFKSEIIRSFKDYRRIEIESDYLVGCVYGKKATQREGFHLGIEGNRSRDLYLADRPIPISVTLEERD